MKKVIPLLSVFLLLLIGCASTPMASKVDDSKAKQFTPLNNRANIYIYHDVIFQGAGAVFEISVDNVGAGIVTNGKFILLQVPEGKHKIDITNTALFRDKLASINGEFFAGKNYFYSSSVFSDFIVVDGLAGRKAVSKLKMAESPDANFLKSTIAVTSQVYLPPVSNIQSPVPLADNSGKYKSPYKSDGAIALWANLPVAETDNCSDIAADVSGAVGKQAANKLLDFVPFGLGGMIGQKAGESAGRAVTCKDIKPELPDMSVVVATSDVSFDKAEDLAVFMYVRYSGNAEYPKVLNLARSVYPEMAAVYESAIQKAAQKNKSKPKTAKEKLKELKELRENGLISDSDYETRKNRILDSM